MYSSYLRPGKITHADMLQGALERRWNQVLSWLQGDAALQTEAGSALRRIFCDGSAEVAFLRWAMDALQGALTAQVAAVVPHIRQANANQGATATGPRTGCGTIATASDGMRHMRSGAAAANGPMAEIRMADAESLVPCHGPALDDDGGMMDVDTPSREATGHALAQGEPCQANAATAYTYAVQCMHDGAEPMAAQDIPQAALCQAALWHRHFLGPPPTPPLQPPPPLPPPTQPLGYHHAAAASVPAARIPISQRLSVVPTRALF
jgi:hypothetical protein